MKDNSFILKGNICYSTSPTKIECYENAYLVCIEGISEGIYQEIPEIYKDLDCIDYEDRLIIPGLIDLHVHAPQYAYRGLGMDLELIDWLNTYAFPEESKYKDVSYAQKAYQMFVNDMVKSPTTRSCIFATLHKESTLLLMDLLEETGMIHQVGKVNMDRNCPEYLREPSPKEAIEITKDWVAESLKRYQYIKPILTPRFVPTCSESVLQGLAHLQKTYGIGFQSHLSENLDEIKWVSQLDPQAKFYGDAYARHGLMQGEPTIMAHCVYSGKEEIKLLKESKTYVAHCPDSNTNIASGIAPMRYYFEAGLNLGLGSDVAGGFSLSIFKAMRDAIQVSKLYYRLVDQKAKPLTVQEAFYLGTKGGGGYFGKVGSFEKGYEFDAIIIEDSLSPYPQELSLIQRLERMVYLSETQHIVGKYVQGRKVYGE